MKFLGKIRSALSDGFPSAKYFNCIIRISFMEHQTFLKLKHYLHFMCMALEWVLWWFFLSSSVHGGKSTQCVVFPEILERVHVATNPGIRFGTREQLAPLSQG